MTSIEGGRGDELLPPFVFSVSCCRFSLNPDIHALIVGIKAFVLLLWGPAKDDNRHAEHGDYGYSPVEDGELLAVHDP